MEISTATVWSTVEFYDDRHYTPTTRKNNIYMWPLCFTTTLAPLQKRTHMHAHTHTLTHTPSQTHTHTHTPSQTHTHTHTHIGRQAPTQTYTKNIHKTKEQNCEKLENASGIEILNKRDW